MRADRGARVAQTSNKQLTEWSPQNTIIISNEDLKSFCRDFSVTLKKLNLEWISLDSDEVPSSIREKNLIIAGNLDAPHMNGIIKQVITQDEAEYAQQGKHYSILVKDSPWEKNQNIIVCMGSDILLTKKSLEEAIFFLAEETSTQHKWLLPPPSASTEEIHEFINKLQFVPGGEELSIEALSMELDPKTPTTLSAEEAVEDMERLFYLLSYGYSGYGYFSLIADFGETKEAIGRDLSTKSTWTPGELGQLIYKHLNFIHDCHLVIGDHKYGENKDFWLDTSLELWRAGGCYHFLSADKEYTVTMVDGGSPEDFMFPSLNAEGEPIYRIGVLSSSAPKPLTLAAMRGQEKTQLKIELTYRELAYVDLREPLNRDVYAEKTIGGIPVVKIKSFSDQYTESLKKFIETASKYRGQPCLIVDIRGNRGGNEKWVKQWVELFTSYAPSRDIIYTELDSKTTMMGRVNEYRYSLNKNPELIDANYPDLIDEFEGYARDFEENYVNPYWYPYMVPESIIISNNTTLIVLMDGNVGSSAEGFLSLLHQVENVVLVGENSQGALTYGQMSRHLLPKSKLQMLLPTSLNIFVDLEHREEKGFNPDLWVPAGEALNYAVAALKRGTLTTVKELPPEVKASWFIPEIQLTVSEVNFFQLGAPFLYFGVITSYFNRKRKNFFLIGTGIFFCLSIFFLSRNPIISYSLIAISLEYLAIGVYKIRKTVKNTPS